MPHRWPAFASCSRTQPSGQHRRGGARDEDDGHVAPGAGQPERFPDPEADALASGAAAMLRSAGRRDTLDEALAGTMLAIGVSARPRELADAVLPMRARRRGGAALRAAGEVALVFGHEMSGLSNDEVMRCQIVAIIPADPDYASLNLAAAVQVMAYECAWRRFDGTVWPRARRSSPRPTTKSRSCSRIGERACTRGFLRSGAPAPAGRACGGCSRARGWRRRRSTSCAASSPGSRNGSRPGWPLR